jgi:hypothetical protein
MVVSYSVSVLQGIKDATPGGYTPVRKGRLCYKSG